MSVTRWTVAGAGLIGVATLLLLIAPVAAQDTTAGEQAYVASCAGCHGADGSGIAGAFPPLVDNPRSLDTAYVSDVIKNGLSGPITVNGVDYDASMPPFGNLGDTVVADIAAYLATNFQTEPPDTATSTTAPEPTDTVTTTTAPEPTDTATTTTAPEPTDTATTTTSVPPPSAGDADRGEDLFLGSTSFENGGTACQACHSAGGRGSLGGQSMGPDLTNVVDNFGGESGLVGVLGAPAFPVMRELYADKPLTDQERADLAAYFNRESTREDQDSGDALLVMGLVGAGILFGGMVVIKPFAGAGYSRRLRRTA